MEYFEIGCCFKSYDELTERLNQYSKETFTKFTTKDCRLIKDEFVENSEAKTRLIYTDLKFICIYGRAVRPKNPEPKRRRAEKNVPTGCPAYFRLKLIQSGVALQIVALNVKHNHPLEPPKEETEWPTQKTRKQRVSKVKAKNRFKEELKSDCESGSENEEEIIGICVEADETGDAEVEFDLKGFCAPVFTPFNDDMTLNTKEVVKYAKYLADNGINAVLVNSTLGEGHLLSIEERKLITETWHEAVTSTNQHLMVQIGGCSLPNVLELAKHAEQFNVNSLLCLPDLNFKPKTSEELTEYLKIVADSAPKTPLLYCHDSSSDGVNINIKEFLEEASEKMPNFRGIYYNSENLSEIINVLNDKSRKYTVLIGSDSLMLGAFALGFDAAIVPSVNFFSEDCVNILKFTNTNDLTKARDLQYKLNEIHFQISKLGNWLPTLKTIMNAVTRLNVGPPRPPLRKSTEDEENEIKKLLLSNIF